MFYRLEMAPEPLFEIARRRFDTPEFRGMEFIESECKTIINPVPGNYLPFNWSINPYRGCSHACQYCVRGSTPILMADGRIKSISDVCVGEEIYGTAQRGNYRRYVKTTVLAHWSTRKPAFHVALADGTELVASGDHRFLTNRGWKHVTGSEWGRKRRPHLTLNNKLMGTGSFTARPVDSAEYRRGYLCGMIRGDGHLGFYAYERMGRAPSRHQGFRLALVDLEALRRSREYLAELALPMQEFEFQAAGETTRAVRAIRTSVRSQVKAIRELCAWPTKPSLDWSKGFLAGVFDAEGSYSGSLRIANTNALIVHTTASCLRELGFAFRLERTGKANGLICVRLLGGLREVLRFFLTVDPAITRKRNIEGMARSRAMLHSMWSRSSHLKRLFACSTSPRALATSSPTAS
jgi:hypothetical protein